MQNLRLGSVDAAISYLKEAQNTLNPRKAKLGKKPIVWISVDNENDFRLLIDAKKQMRNVKWVGIIQEERKGVVNA